MSVLATQSAIPRVGMIATVRNRRGVVAAVEPFDGDSGRLHLVHVEYKDLHEPPAERLLWELEPERSLLEPTELPDAGRDPMPPGEFDALLRAARWTALSPYLDPDGSGPLDREPLASPFHGGVRVEDYQLMPLLKALRMPRVSLLLADDVGLGKTVEAGLVLTELLLRRRIRRVLVLTPASLRQQWRDELWEKFSLRFDVVDRQGAERLRRRLGMDANPWRSSSRIVASYHYLRQPDVREQFLAACHTPDGSPHLPWDLLIVDECHNLMPSPFGEDSGLCETLRLAAPRFEHRLFLSATPHNGHTRSFTGLLEMLDPVRFTRTSEMTQAMRARVDDVVVRRLKRQIDQPPGRTSAGTRREREGDALPGTTPAPRFCQRRPPEALTLRTEPREADLVAAFDAFRKAVRRLVAQGNRTRRRAGNFAVEILGKRLLSCPTAFAESWRRARQGFADESTASEAALTAAEQSLWQETGDDRETQQREATAATVVGAWLKNFADDVQSEITGIQRALDALTALIERLRALANAASSSARSSRAGADTRRPRKRASFSSSSLSSPRRTASQRSSTSVLIAVSETSRIRLGRPFLPRYFAPAPATELPEGPDAADVADHYLRGQSAHAWSNWDRTSEVGAAKSTVANLIRCPWIVTVSSTLSPTDGCRSRPSARSAKGSSSRPAWDLR